MKKLIPIIALSATFMLVMVSQMLINGDHLSASKMKADKKKFAAYETNFRKLEVETTKGQVVRPYMSGKKLVIINFWASWCRPCLSEFKSLNKLIDKIGKDNLLVIGINNDTEEPLTQIKKIEDKLSLKFDSVSDAKSEITRSFFVSQIPASIVFYNGSVVEYHDREFDFMNDKFIKKLENLIK